MEGWGRLEGASWWVGLSTQATVRSVRVGVVKENA